MHHALLIGLNFYPKTGTGEWRPLRGCVRDILAIEAQLTKSHNRVQIRKLVASAAGTEPPRPAEDVECLPTYSNLTSGLQQIILDASAGDLVYIHFTGHGTAIEPTTPFASTGTGELALVVLASDDPTNKMQYLRGSELAYWMKAMVAADLKVTLVLDCCASGSVVRDKSDQSVRYLPYDRAIDVAYPPDTERSLGPNEKGEGIIRAADRDASLRQNWMVNPDGYTILTACGPTEVAREINVNGCWHGALSYFLVRTFVKNGRVGGKLGRIYPHLCARFKESWPPSLPRQNPMLYGNRTLYFFDDGTDEGNEAARIAVVTGKGGGLELEAGHAHGVCVGDEFAVYPSPTAPIRPIAIVKVTQLRPLTSDLIQMTPFESRSGMTAAPLTRLALRRFPIQIESPALREAALRERRQSLNICDTAAAAGARFSIHTAVVEEDCWRIRDSMGNKILDLVTGSDNPAETARTLLDALEHLIMFQMVKELSNESMADPSYCFRQSFCVQLLGADGQVFAPVCQRERRLQTCCLHPECLVKVRDGERVELVVRNLEKEDGNAIYIHLYVLGACWEIYDLLCADYEVNPARTNGKGVDFKKGTIGVWRKKIKMTIPPELKERGRPHCDDTFKLFLTTQPTSFALLELPELDCIGRRSERKGGNRGGAGGLSDAWAAISFRVRTHAR
jgi:hypothetical protein